MRKWLGDIDRLCVQQDLDVGTLPVETVLLVADILNGVTHHFVQQLERHRFGTAHFTGDHDLVGGRQGFAGDARLRIGAQERVDDRIGDTVAHLVRVSFGNRLAGEKISGEGHTGPPLESSAETKPGGSFLSRAARRAEPRR